MMPVLSCPARRCFRSSGRGAPFGEACSKLLPAATPRIHFGPEPRGRQDFLCAAFEAVNSSSWQRQICITGDQFQLCSGCAHTSDDTFNLKIVVVEGEKGALVVIPLLFQDVTWGISKNNRKLRNEYNKSGN